MSAALWGFRAVAGGDEDSDSDGDGWDIGVVRKEPQVGLSLSAAGGLEWGLRPGRLGAGRGEAREPASARNGGEGSGARWASLRRAASGGPPPP